MPQKTDKILDTADLMKFFGVSEQTVWRWCKAGKLPAFKIGSQWKVRQSDLHRTINQKVGIKESRARSGGQARRAPDRATLF